MTVAGYQTETAEHHGDVDFFTLRIRGEVTHAQASALREQVVDAVQNRPFQRIVLSLSNLEHLDHVGAAVLVEAVVLGRKLGKNVYLCSPSDMVMDTFRIAGLTEAFDACCPNPDVTWRRVHED